MVLAASGLFYFDFGIDMLSSCDDNYLDEVY